MHTFKHTSSAVLALCGALLASTAFADFDQWRIEEVFSSADGIVQFIELRSQAENQQDLTGLTLIASNSNNQLQNSFTFSQNLGSSTMNATLLLATESFAQLTGLTPDFLISPNFLFTEGGSLNFAAGIDSVSYSKEQLPRGGVQSLQTAGSIQQASPQNYSGLSASIAVDPVATFDDATSIMNLPELVVPGIGIANLNFSINLEAVTFTLLNDFYLYADGVVPGPSPATLTDGVLYIPAFQVGNELYEFSMPAIAEDPFVFGNLEIHSVTNLLPDPEPTPLELSIARGQQDFQGQCASCHGASGEGTEQGRELRLSSINTFEALRGYIDAAMPLPPANNPASCRDGVDQSCASDTANFILNVIQ